MWIVNKGWYRSRLKTPRCFQMVTMVTCNIPVGRGPAKKEINGNTQGSRHVSLVHRSPILWLEPRLADPRTHTDMPALSPLLPRLMDMQLSRNSPQVTLETPWHMPKLPRPHQHHDHTAMAKLERPLPLVVCTTMAPRLYRHPPEPTPRIPEPL